MTLDEDYASQVYAAVNSIVEPDILVTHAIVLYAYTRAEEGGFGFAFKTTDTPDWMLRGMMLEADAMILDLSRRAVEDFEEDDDADG